LNAVSEEKSTVSLGKQFQMLTIRSVKNEDLTVLVFILLRILTVVLTNSSHRVFCSVCRLPYLFVPGIFIICELDTLHVKAQSPPQGSGD